MCCLSFKFVMHVCMLVWLKHALHLCISFRNDDGSMGQHKDVGIKQEDDEWWKSRRWWLDHILKMKPTNLVLISYPGKPRCITPIFQAHIIMLLCIKLQELLETHLHKYSFLWVLLVWQESCSMPCYRTYGRTWVMGCHSREIGPGYIVIAITWFGYG